MATVKFLERFMTRIIVGCTPTGLVTQSLLRFTPTSSIRISIGISRRAREQDFNLSQIRLCSKASPRSLATSCWLGKAEPTRNIFANIIKSAMLCRLYWRRRLLTTCFPKPKSAAKLNMHVHGDNLQQKETAEVKYADAESRQFLREIRKQYEVWRTGQ